MAVDDRILYLIRQEVDRVLAEAAAGPDDLHTELHALATKLAQLEARVAELEAPQGAVPRASRPRRTPKQDGASDWADA